MEKHRIAILGAGMLGTCLALEMAQQGAHVDVYDRESQGLTQAGSRNEGKIHLGFVYGADSSFKTTKKMIDGGMLFLPLLRRWVGPAIDSIRASSPFYYAIAENSILSPKDFEMHCQKIEAELSRHRPSDYPGQLIPAVKKIEDKEYLRQFNPQKIQAAYRTCEKAIDIHALAKVLRNKVASTPQISFFPNSTIVQVEQRPGQLQLQFITNSERRKKLYDIVINALWEGRMEIDQQMGLWDPPPWCYRLKHAIFLSCPSPLAIPSTTIIQGPYGDLVNFGQGDYYLSWYPKCMQGFAKNTIIPPNWNRNLSQNEAKQLTSEVIQSLSEFIPAVGSIREENMRNLRVLGGIIYARGETDVEDPKSGLHTRHEPAIKSNQNYYSINPGKYSLCPAFAYQAATEICPELYLQASPI